MTVSIAELQAKGYLQMVDPLWGECLIIPTGEFTHDMEVSLAAEGLRCHYSSLDGHAVVFVQLKKSTAAGKTVYVPPSKPVMPVVEPKDGRGNGNLEVKETKEEEIGASEIERTEYVDTENALLLKEYDALAATGKKYGALKIVSIMPQFRVHHSESGIKQHLKRLLKNREKNKASNKGAESTKSEKSTVKVEVLPTSAKYAPFEDVWTFADRNESPLKKRAEAFYEAAVEANLPGAIVGSVISCFQECDANEKLMADQIADNERFAVEVEQKIKDLRKEFCGHKHAVSGEAMLPLEGS